MTPAPARLPLSRRRLALWLGSAAVVGAGLSPQTSMRAARAADGAEVFFETVEDGATVSSPLSLSFGVRGKMIAPAGMEKQNSGHFVLLIDRPPFWEDPSRPNEAILPLPSDANHRLFTGGQREVVLELSPGPHTLQLVLADSYGVPHRPPIVSDRIGITVQ